MNGKRKSVGCIICEMCSDCLVLNLKSSLDGHTIRSGVTVWAVCASNSEASTTLFCGLGPCVTRMFSDMGSSLFYNYACPVGIQIVSFENCFELSVYAPSFVGRLVDRMLWKMRLI